MLSQLRDASKGWIAGILVFLLIAAFAVWGIEDVFRLRPETTVAEIGDRKIEARTFAEEFDRLRENIGAQSGQPVPRDQAIAFGLHQVALNQLISREVMAKEARDMRLAVSDRVLTQKIREFEPFQDPITGEFSRELYRELLRNRVQMSPTGFEEAMREDLVREQLAESVTAGIRAPRSLAQSFFRFQEQRRRVSYLVVPETAIGTLDQPGDEELAAFYEEQKSRFVAPETRDFTYVVLKAEEIAAKMDVSEEDLKQAYEVRKAGYINPEKRSIRQVVFPTMEEAQAAKAKIEGGQSLLDIAQARSLSQGDIDLGELAREDFLESAYGEAAFALEGTGVTDPVEGDFGVAIIEVLNVSPRSEKTFAQVRDELKQTLAIDEARDKVFDIMASMQDAFAEGQTLSEAAKANDLEVRTVSGASRRGTTVSGEPASETPIPPAVLTQVFESDIELENDFEQTADESWFVSYVTGITPQAQKPLETVRDEVKAEYMAQKRGEALTALGKSLAERAMSGETLKALSTEVSGRIVTPVEPIGRDGADDQLTGNLVNALFRAQANGVVDGPSQGGGSYIVARVQEIVPADEQQELFAVAQVQQSLEEALTNDVAEQFVVALRDEFGVEVNNRAVSAALGQTEAAQ